MSQHKFDEKFLKKHVKTSGKDGACLNRHISPYKEDHSCSHRWQAYKKAKTNPTWYDYPAYHSVTNTNPATEFLPPTVQWGQWLTGSFWKPRPGDWDLGSKSFGGMFNNFRGWSRAPYWHNAHHIIPNGVLRDSLQDLLDIDRRVYVLARAGLLEAKYNLNDMENMVILPMSKVVAAAICLPRHIAGVEAPPGSQETRSHRTYSLKIKEKVDKEIGKFANQVDIQDHKIKAGKLAKENLVKISQKVYSDLRTWALTAKGGSVDEAADSL